MSKFRLRALAIAGACLFGAGLVCAQDWNTVESLPNVNLDGLTQAQKVTVLKLLREHGCPCGCGMKAAECRVKDPKCFYSRGIASVVVDAVRSGKNEGEAWAEAEASRFAHPPEQKILEDPVPIPVDGSPVLGPKDAAITLVEFSDFQCPYCSVATPQLKEVLKAYPTQVKLIFKEFPLDIHSQAELAAKAAIAAHKQGKFWSMHDALFASRTDLSRPAILALASGLGLDMKRFEADLASPAVKQLVDRDVEDGSRIGVMGTPTLFIDGKHYNGAIRIDMLKPLLDAELKNPGGAPKTASAAHPASH
jgi:protein-disulfide isomerase